MENRKYCLHYLLKGYGDSQTFIHETLDEKFPDYEFVLKLVSTGELIVSVYSNTPIPLIPVMVIEIILSTFTKEFVTIFGNGDIDSSKVYLLVLKTNSQSTGKNTPIGKLETFLQQLAMEANISNEGLFQEYGYTTFRFEGQITGYNFTQKIKNLLDATNQEADNPFELVFLWPTK